MIMTTNVKVETERLIEVMTSEDYGYSLTENINEAIYILHDGRMISGDFYYGSRSTDHRMIECAFDNIDRYTPGFWETVHETFQLVRLVPESKYALIKVGQELTNVQRMLVKLGGYKVEEY